MSVWHRFPDDFRSHIHHGADIDEPKVFVVLQKYHAETMYSLFAESSFHSNVATFIFENGANIWWKAQVCDPRAVQHKALLRLVLSWLRVCEDVGRMIADM